MYLLKKILKNYKIYKLEKRLSKLADELNAKGVSKKRQREIAKEFNRLQGKRLMLKSGYDAKR